MSGGSGAARAFDERVDTQPVGMLAQPLGDGALPQREHLDAIGRQGLYLSQNLAIAAEPPSHAVDRDGTAAADIRAAQRSERGTEIAEARRLLIAHLGRQAHETLRRRRDVFGEPAERIIRELTHRVRKEAKIALEGGS